MNREEKAVYFDLLFDLEDDLKLQLRDGLLTASGFRHGEIEPVTPSGHWWADASLNTPASTAEGYGTVLLGVRVARPSAPPAPAADMAAQAAEWMRAHMMRSPRPKRVAALPECSRQTGCTYRQALAAWNALAEDVRNPEKRGRR